MPPCSTFLKVSLTLLLSAAAAGCGGGDPATEAEQEAREEAFRQSMSGVVLEGFFTVGDGSELRKERYEIAKVSKLGGDVWVFQARIQYGSRDVTVPVPVRMEWAGDTPVLSLTEVAIPGLGTFTARVLFYDEQYVGVWSHGEVGGLHFGRIVPDPNQESAVGKPPLQSELAGRKPPLQSESAVGKPPLRSE